MWETKTFKTKLAMDAWLFKHCDTIQYNEIYVNNAYGIEFRKLRVVY
jgi:hypothetical protein